MIMLCTCPSQGFLKKNQTSGQTNQMCRKICDYTEQQQIFPLRSDFEIIGIRSLNGVLLTAYCFKQPYTVCLQQFIHSSNIYKTYTVLGNKELGAYTRELRAQGRGHPGWTKHHAFWDCRRKPQYLKETYQAQGEHAVQLLRGKIRPRALEVRGNSANH